MWNFLTTVRWRGPNLDKGAENSAFHLHFDSGQRVIIRAPGLEGANSRELNSKCPLQGFSDIDWGDRQHLEAKHVGLNLRTSRMQLLKITFLVDKKHFINQESFTKVSNPNTGNKFWCIQS